MALTPLPQWCTTVLACLPANSRANSSRNSAALLKNPCSFKLVLKRRLRAPGMCPATGSKGSTSPRNRAGARASINVCDVFKLATTVAVSTSGSNGVRTEKLPVLKVIGIVLPVSTEPPAAFHACKPPSSTATAAWPHHLSIHHMRPQ